MRITRGAVAAALAFTLAVSASAITVLGQGGPGGGEIEPCVYSPNESCCQCVAKGDTPEEGSTECYENPGGGGTFYCSAQVCPFTSPPCCNGQLCFP